MLVSILFLVGGFRGFKVEVSDSDPNNFEGVKNDRSTRRTGNVPLPSEDKDYDSEEKHTEWKEISCPKIDAEFQLSSCHTGQTTDVDGPVKPGVHTLDGNCWVDNDSFAILEDFNVSLCIGVLFDDQGGDIGLDSSCAETNDKHCDDEASRVGCCICLWDRGTDENKLADGVECREKHDGFVATEILVRDNGANDGAYITPEVREGTKRLATRIGRSFPNQWLLVVRDQDILSENRQVQIGYNFGMVESIHNK